MYIDLKKMNIPYLKKLLNTVFSNNVRYALVNKVDDDAFEFSGIIGDFEIISRSEYNTCLSMKNNDLPDDAKTKLNNIYTNLGKMSNRFLNDGFYDSNSYYSFLTTLEEISELFATYAL